jgi:hypothetical protein
VLVLPSITGEARVNTPLTADPGEWSGEPAPTFTYQWQNNSSGWQNIAGATQSSYIPVEEDTGFRIRVVVTATNLAGAVSATSPVTLPVLPDEQIPTVVTNPEITGAVSVNKTLTTTLGTFTGYPTPTISIQWQSSQSENGPWANVSGATTATYTLPDNRIGYYFRTQTTAINSEGSVVATSNVVGPVTPEISTKSSVLPMTNARLLAITAPPVIGVIGDGEFGNGDSPQIKWIGNADAFVQITMRRTTKTNSTVGGGMSDRYKETVVTIPYLVSMVQGTVITVDYNGRQYEWEIGELIEARYDAGMPEVVKCYIINQ